MSDQRKLCGTYFSFSRTTTAKQEFFLTWKASLKYKFLKFQGFSGFYVLGRIRIQLAIYQRYGDHYLYLLESLTV